MKTKRIITSLLSLFLCIQSNSKVNASVSSSYIKGDINNDGVVSVVDLAYIQQFLGGSVTADGRTAERLDVNSDYIIDYQDKSALSEMLFNNQSNLNINYIEPSDLPEKTNRTYYVYNPTTGNRRLFETYTLPSLNYIPTNGISTASIVGVDNRIQENDADMRGVINVQDSNGRNVGTAFVIDSNTLLTAAHVLKDSNTGKAKSGLQFKIFEDSTTQSTDTITPVRYHIPLSYMNNSRDDYDYAIVTVEEDLSAYINFSLGVARKGIASSTSKNIYVTGFGSRGTGVSSDLIDIKSTGSGSLVVPPSDYYENYELCYYTDTIGGDSGSPAYIINNDGTRTVIGIHVRGFYQNHPNFNSATKITPDILNFVYYNTNLTALD